MKHVVLTMALAAAGSVFAQTAPNPAQPAVAVEQKPSAAAIAVPASEASTGKAAWYGNKFNGRRTASGERFNAAALTAASKTLPFGTLVRVTNPKNKRSVVVRINDRGPSQPDRIIDLSRAAAARIGILRAGVAEVELKTIGSAKGKRAKKS